MEGKVLGVISITGILLGVSFLYPVITGNIIGFTNNVNLIGSIFLVIGLIVGFFG